MEIQLSVVIITFNEEKNILRCLKSVQDIADEIVVIDSFSTDATKDICIENNVRFIENKFEGHIQQKNFAAAQARYDYVLSLDADECLSPKAILDISTLKKNWQFDGYFLNRLNNYCGKWVKHGGWYPDKKLRVWDRRLGTWQGTNPHDEYRMEKSATLSYLKSDILHFTIENRQQHIVQIQKFSKIGAQARFEKGKRSNLLFAYFSFVRKFVSGYLLKLGFLDGKEGFQIAYLSAWSRYLRHYNLIQLHSKR